MYLKKKKKKSWDSHIFSHILELVVRKHSKAHRLVEAGRDSNAKKKIANWFFEYAHDTFTYFEGQVKIILKFCFACYAFPFTYSWTAKNTVTRFINKVYIFEGCLEKLFTIKDAKGR